MTTINPTEYLTETIKFQKRQAEAAKATFTNNLQSYGLPYALEWANDNAVTAALAELWVSVEFMMNSLHRTPAEALEIVLEQTKESLLKNYIVKRSTDQFTNAMSQAKAEASARFVNEATHVLYRFKTAE